MNNIKENEQKLDTIGERICFLIKEKGMNKKQLAEEAGCTPLTLSRYIKNDRIPSGYFILRIAEVLNTSTDFILGIDYQEDPDRAFVEVLRAIKKHRKVWTEDQKRQIVNTLFEV